MTAKKKEIRLNFYLTQRFFYLFSVVGGLFVIAFPFPVFFPLAQTALAGAGAAVLADGIILFSKRKGISCRREMQSVLSLGSQNTVNLIVKNLRSIPVQLTIRDELPEQLQSRNFKIKLRLSPGKEKTLTYPIRPLSRGEYTFGKVNIYTKSRLGLAERRYRIPIEETTAVYPSVIEMQDISLRALSRISTMQGIKKLRRRGHGYEFDQIKEYVRGDDFQSINWKATSRSSTLMVNHYTDEKSQRIYSVIDKSRSMKMPFNGLSLLDYAVNASLVISNVALNKEDKAGLITFSEKTGSLIKADNRKQQLHRIMETLYKEEEGRLEADYERLYHTVRNFVKGRSLIFLYTNFESIYSLQRVLPIIRKINRLHLLTVIIFENTELIDYTARDAKAIREIYFQTAAAKFLSEKRRIINELEHIGVQTILTRPEDLSVNTVNKYLELKAKGMI